MKQKHDHLIKITEKKIFCGDIYIFSSFLLVFQLFIKLICDIFNLFICQMIAQGSIVKNWAQSTESKIKQFVDDYLINYPQNNVRSSTEKLLTSLFRKGTQAQRRGMIQLLTLRAHQLNSMGRASQEFLTLVTNIFKIQPQNPAQLQIFGLVWTKVKEIFGKITNHRDYELYSLCSNMIDFGQEFKPYLLEANGCLQCFGKPQIDFQQSKISNIMEELRAHLNSVEWVLKRTYQLKNLNVSFAKKKINYKSLLLYYNDQNGIRKQLGKFGPADTLPPFNITTNVIGMTFQFAKARRNHITCIMCSAAEQYASLCSNCIGKLVDIDASVKVITGNTQKINKELAESFKLLNTMRDQLEKFALCVKEQSKATLLKVKIVTEMQNCYGSIIQNLRLLRQLTQNQLKEEKKAYRQVNSDCYSCHFYEFVSCAKYILSSLGTSLVIPLSTLQQLLIDFTVIFNANKIHAYGSTLSSILAEILNRFQKVDYSQQIEFGTDNKGVVQLLISLIQQFKTHHKQNSSLLDLQTFILDQKSSSKLSIQQRIKLFISLVLNEEQLFYITQQNLQIQKLQDIKRLSNIQFQRYSQLLSFPIQNIFTLPITNSIKLFLVLLPEQKVPASNLDISDAAYLKFIKNVPPFIDDQLIMSKIVFSPNPIIKLNMFKLLPQIIQQLPLQSCIELIQQLCKYKPVWNSYIRETVQCFDHMLEEVEKQRKLMLCLQGYDKSKQNIYFDHIFKILTPQRPSFIIRLEIPEKQMQKQQKNKGGPVEYIYLPVRQVKSEELKGDTIGALHEWITQQIRRMNHDMTFDLIVQNNIIDNLDLSLEIIYKKLVQKQTKRQIGNQTYHFFRVIYRIQGIFGEANQRNCGNPRDQKLQQCINFSSHLLSKLHNSSRTGLDVLMEIIPTLSLNLSAKDRRDKMVKILQIIFRNQSIIRKVVEWEYGNSILSMAVKFISLQKQDLRATETLLEMCSKIIDEANNEMVRIRKNSGFGRGRKGSQGEMDIQGEGEQSEKAVKFVLQRVREAQEGGFKHISKKLIKILPFCSRDDLAASKYLYQYFQVNKIFELKYSHKLTWFQQFIQALSESYSSFKTICRQEGITNSILQFIAAKLPNIETVRDKDTVQSLELSMTLLKGLVQGDFQFQEQLFEQGILANVNRIGGVGSGGLSQEARSQLGKIPLICFQIIKYFQEGKMISTHVHQYFVKNQEEKKKAIQTQKSKRKQLIMMKKKKVLDSLEHLIKNEDNQLLVCSSCKEGYNKKKQVLGVYLYSTKLEILSIENWWKDNKKYQSVTSTSYFEPIHLECHNQALKDDLKIQKTQWDGAIIRNSQVLCNNWCPFKGPTSTDEDFDKACRKYFERNNKNVSFWIVLNDLNGLLDRFSKQFNFALETKGSSYTHNAKLIPVLMALTCHLLKTSQQVKYLRQGINYIEENLTKKYNLVILYFSIALFIHSQANFMSKKSFCLKLIENLGFGNFKDSKPLYVYLALIHSIMKVTHQNIPEGSDIALHLSASIPKKFNDCILSFESVAEEYKNIYLKWQNIEQARNYFQQ